VINFVKQQHKHCSVVFFTQKVAQKLQFSGASPWTPICRNYWR